MNSHLAQLLMIVVRVAAAVPLATLLAARCLAWRAAVQL